MRTDGQILRSLQSLFAIFRTIIYRVMHKSVNTPLSHERLVGGLQDGGRGTHVTHFVQLYCQPLYTASQVRTTSRSWDEGVLTDLCLTLYNIPTRCDSGSIVFIKNYKYVLHVSDALCVHHQEHYKL